MPRLDLAVALGVGVGGALVDVSSYARLTDGLSYRWGRTDAFYGVEPGTFSFTLDNSDGRFTPENPSSPLDTTLTEGMAACVQVGSRLTAGVVRSIEPEFPSGEAAWSRVRVTCDDVFGRLSREQSTNPLDDVVTNAGLFALWKFADDATSSGAVDSGPFSLPAISRHDSSVPPVSFGANALVWGSETQAQTGATPYAPIAPMYGLLDVGQTFDYLPDTAGAYGFWFTLNTPSTSGGSAFSFDINSGAGTGPDFQLGLTGNPTRMESAARTLFAPAMTLGVPYYFSVTAEVDATNVVYTYYMDGVSYGSQSVAHAGAVSAADLSLKRITMRTADVSAVTDYVFSRLSHTRVRAAEERLKNAVTLSGWFYAIESATLSAATFDTFPDVWESSTDYISTDVGSALDLLNLALETEQGYAYAVTTGTLTSPTEKVVIRRRERPTTVTESFNVEDELQGAPAFIRDITNLVATVRVDSTTGSRQTVTDSTLTARVGNASDTVELPLTRAFDMRAWAQDRINRGGNTKMQIQSVVVDAMTTPTDRSADLLALVPGDRVQFTNLPSTQLGFDTWDGWFLGASETHNLVEHSFALYFQPVLPAVAKYDTATYMASGELKLNGAINAAVTSISVESTGALLSTTAVPYVMQVDDEQMTVTAVSGASSPQTVTVTRAANGTTAATHADNAVLVGPIPESIYAF